MGKPSNSTWPNYLVAGVGRRLSLWGERWNMDWLIYNPIHFRHFHRQAILNAPGVVAAIVKLFPDAHSVLDVGSGSGAFSAEFGRIGLSAVACERSRTGRSFAKRQGVDCRPFDLLKIPPADVPERCDLAICFEVGEHLSEPLGQELVKFLAARATQIVFTAAHPGQGGTGHVNEQPKSYWIRAFEAQGVRYSDEHSKLLEDGFRANKVPAPWFADNVLVFKH